MTDNDIVKALECCTNEECADCKHCPLDDLHRNDCFSIILHKHSLDLINRQKAEIERLSEDVDGYKAELESEHLSRMDNIHDLITEIKKSKAEAIKEFAERLKAEGFHHKNFGDLVQFEDIDCLVKEMTEDTNHE